MSAEDPSAATGMRPAVPAPGPRGAGCILGTLLVLALVLGGVAWIAQGLFVAGVDGAEKQREYFGEKPLPFGLVLESAVRLPGGAARVSFARAEGESPGPSDVVLLEPGSREAAAALLRGTFEEVPGGAGARIKEWEKDKAFAWHMTRKRGDIAWGTWSSKLLIERAFEQGGPWREEARVDLSSAARALVLLAHWPAETAVDEKALRELLTAVVLAPPGE